MTMIMNIELPLAVGLTETFLMVVVPNKTSKGPMKMPEQFMLAVIVVI